MADSKDAQKSKASKAAKPDKPKAAKPADSAKPAKDKAAKKDKGEAAAAPEAPAKPAPAPRPPADPRMKFIKKFQGRFLPKGPLRDRAKLLLERWNSAEDHGGVTVEELKQLLADWRASQAKRSRTTVG
jgi:hypothetical protein